jgi:hypothetical protein
LHQLRVPPQAGRKSIEHGQTESDDDPTGPMQKGKIQDHVLDVKGFMPGLAVYGIRSKKSLDNQGAILYPSPHGSAQ